MYNNINNNNKMNKEEIEKITLAGAVDVSKFMPTYKYKSYIELTWWNQKTYEDVRDFYENGHRRCAITNATGTGKTSVISSIIHDYYDGEHSVLVITPRDNISVQYENDFYQLGDMVIDYITYSMLGRMNSSGAIEKFKNYKLIVFDEFHRSGAKTWLPAADNLINLNPEAKVLGASATPKRLDQRYKNEDMVDILFDDHRAGEFDIVTCLKFSILPMPTYVTAMYTSAINKLENDTMKEIDKIKNKEDKIKFINELKECKINWQDSYGYDRIFNCFLDFDNIENENNKIIVFCKNINHIHEMRENFDPIFEKMYKNMNISLTIDEYHVRTNEEPFNNFKNNNDPGTVQILYTVDKLEEGVHVPGIKAIIMVRDTTSPIKYFQQIGRALSLSGVDHPIIIDLVANSYKVKGAKEVFVAANIEIENDINEFLNDYFRNKDRGGKATRNVKVGMYDYVENGIQVFERVRQKAIDESLYEYKGEKGTYSYFAEKYHKNKSEIYSKIVAQGFSIKEAIETSDDAIDYDVIYKGEKVNIEVLLRRKGIYNSLNVINYRYKINNPNNRTIEEIIDERIEQIKEINTRKNK